MSKNKIGFVAVGYKNSIGMKRLLESLNNANYEDEVTIIISIDFSGDESVFEVSNSFQWKHGDKIIRRYEQNLGLREHILRCGDYIDEYAFDAIAVFEDDIYVSPNVYNYIKQSLLFFGNDERIAGISLYKHEFNIFAKHPFCDLNDGGDNFFIQYAQSWGQVWMRESWHEFKKWYESQAWENMDDNLVPDNVKGWKKSWLKYHIMYCIDTNRYFVYPRFSLTTDFSDAGVHGKVSITDMQVPLLYSDKNEWSFKTIDCSNAIYDAFFENVKLKSFLNLESVTIDLYDKKKNYATKYLVTLKHLNCKIVKKWGLKLRPIEANIFQQIDGDEIFLYDLTITEKHKRVASGLHLLNYELKGINLLTINTFRLVFKKTWNHLKTKFLRIKKKERRRS